MGGRKGKIQWSLLWLLSNCFLGIFKGCGLEPCCARRGHAHFRAKFVLLGRSFCQQTESGKGYVLFRRFGAFYVMRGGLTTP